MIVIAVDFNSVTPDGKKVLVAQNRNQDKEIVPMLREGMHVLLLSPGEFEVQGILEPEEVDGEIWWYGVPDWTTVRDFT